MVQAHPAAPRVLVVDDNHDAADTTGELLRLFGCEVQTCYDGPSALNIARSFHPQICFFDLNMPGMDGDELAERVRDALPGERILFAAVTAMGGDDALQRTRRAGFQMHFVKPVDPASLLGVVSN